MNKELTQEYLKSILDYEPETGILRWKVRKSTKFKIGDIAGWIDARGYRCICIDGKEYKAHNIIYFYNYGMFPPNNLYIDHINHRPHDNRLNNFRLTTHKVNLKNTKLSKNNSSGFNGVIWDKNRNRWLAQIFVNNKHIFLGRFEKKEDAIEARKKANIEYGFHNNHGKTQEEIGNRL